MDHCATVLHTALRAALLAVLWSAVLHIALGAELYCILVNQVQFSMNCTLTSQEQRT